MQGGLITREIVPFYASLLVLGAAALVLDAVLHLANAVWLGRWLGIPGVLLILGSFTHSLRKRKIITRGNPVRLLRLHEWMAWAGSLLVLVHAGIHFNALLAWLALAAMLVNIASGLTGKYLLRRAHGWLREAKGKLREAGAGDEEIELSLHWDSLVFDIVRQWRRVHYPISLAFAVLALAHIVAVFLFWGVAMTRRWVWIGIGLLLLGVIAAAFVWPHQMVSPGNLRPAHAALQQDCFACHKPFAGASADKCVACHKVADIGRLTTKGQPVRMSRSMPPFHQALTEKNCMACHSDHPAPRLAAGRAATFDHALLAPSMRGQCQSCHRPPQDTLHRAITQPCAQCHATRGWRPATFDHSRFFLLEGDHNAACSTCHKSGNFKQYTCYGCHEHQPAQIMVKHEEEGIRNIDNCVRCHRSAREGGEHGAGGEGEGSD